MEVKRIKVDEVWALSEKNAKTGRIYLLANKQATTVLNDVYSFMKTTATNGENEFHFTKHYKEVSNVDLKKMKEIIETNLKEDGYVYNITIINDTSFEVKVSAPL